MKLILASHLELIGWHSLFSLLAWERAEPAVREAGLAHLDLAGLRLRAQSFLRLRAQSFLVDSRSRYRAGDRSEVELLVDAQAFLDRTLEGVRKELGDEALVRVLSLAASLSYSHEGPAYYRWVTHRFSYWRDISSVSPRPPIEADSLAEIIKLIDNWRADDVSRTAMINAITNEPPAELELELGGRSPTGAPLSLSLLYHALHMAPARALWAEIRAMLTPAELDALVAWLNKQDRQQELSAGVPLGRTRGLDDLC